MASALVTLCMIFLFLVTGQILEGLKRILMLITDLFLKFLDLLGINIFKKESRLKMSKEFSKTFKEIHVVKKSKQNRRLKPSINTFALITFLVSLFLVIVDLEVVSGGVVSNWLYTHTFFNKIVKSSQSMTVVCTTTLFSIMSFSISKLTSQWKETKELRKTRREIKKRNYVFQQASSRELLDAAKMYDAQRYDQLKREDNQC